MRTRASHRASTVDEPYDSLFFQVLLLASQQRTTKAAQNDMCVILFHTKTSQSNVLVLTPRNRRKRHVKGTQVFWWPRLARHIFVANIFWYVGLV